MRLPLILAAVLCSLSYTGASQAAPPKKPGLSRKLGLQIRVEAGDWGQVRTEQIETVLYAVADELLSRLPQKLAVPIVVSHTDRNPVALYERGTAGEYRIQLHARGESWHLYTYEFAHELCHILSNYDENAPAGHGRYNQWFEETLCETASLYTLKSLAETWAENPPASEWRGQSTKLERFYDLLISEGHRQLPPHAPLAGWLADNESRLRQDPYLRDKNEVIANLLLPLFQRNPENWDTLAYLNLDPDDARSSLKDYLAHWYRNAPLEHRNFIADVLALFHLQDAIGPVPDSPRKVIASAGNAAPEEALGQVTHRQ